MKIHLLIGGLALAAAVTPAHAQPANPEPPAEAAAAAPASEQAADDRPLDVRYADLRTAHARQATALANARQEVDRLRREAALKDELLALGRKRNAELYGVASEVLARLGDLSWRDTAARLEPFVQAKRVELENLVQSYEDRLRAARVYETTLPPSLEQQMRQELKTSAAAAAPTSAR